MHRVFNEHPDWFQAFLNDSPNNVEKHCIGVRGMIVYYNKSTFSDGVPVLKTFDRAEEYIYDGDDRIVEVEVDIPEGTPCVYDQASGQAYMQFADGWIWSQDLDNYVE